MGVFVREKVKGSGEWWLFINHKGRRKSKKIGDKKIALEVADRIKAKLVLGDFGLDDFTSSEAPLFKEYCRLWLEGYIKSLRRASTYERYNDVLDRYVIPALGNIPIKEIRRADVRNLILKQYERGLSKSSVCMIRDVISGVMSYAVDDELIPANPVTGITKKMGLERQKKASGETLTQEEVNLFLSTCLKIYPEHYPFFLCAFRTGMRLGELLGLQWGDIDWNGKFIHVRRSFKNGRMSPTKTGRTRRVDMSDQLLEALGRLHTERKREALGAGRGQVVETVFHRNGRPMAQNSIRHIFKRILSKAGLRSIRFHDIRHTFASLLLSNGQSPVYVKDQLGHSSIQITVDIYGHLIPSSNREAVNQLDSPDLGAPTSTLYAPQQKGKDVTIYDYVPNAFLVPKGRLELPRPCGH